ncbi:MAG TPA: AarF/UbiB family protein [Ktedonobacterales bacterium]
MRSRRNRFWRSYRVASLLLRTLWIVNHERSRVVRARARGDYDVRPDLEALLRILREFRQTAVDLGGLLIKLGQFLGARADVLPVEALAELAALQDEVPPERFQDIAAVIQSELGAPLSELFVAVESKPAGSASLGQVHRAQLKDGRIIALKVQRPGIHRIVQTDLRTLRFVLGIVRRVAPSADRLLDLRMLYREFSRTVFEELDYQREGHNAEHFAQIFASDPSIIAPKVIWEYTTRHVLALEWMDGIKITHVDELDAACVDRDALAIHLANAYFKQVFESGFFHADPHPGNILVQPHALAAADGQSVAPGDTRHNGVRLVFVDFGMVGVITPRMRGGLRDCFGGVVRQDAALVVQGLDELGFLGEAADRDAIEQIIGMMLTRFSALPFGQIRDVNQQEVMGDVGSVLYDQPLRLPAQFAFFGRMVGMLVGLTALLSPKFNFAQVAAPYAQQFLQRDGINGLLSVLGVGSVGELGRTTLREGVSLAQTMVALPRRLDRLLARAERGELRLVVESATFNRRTRLRNTQRTATNAFNRPVPAWVPLGIAGAFVVTLFLRRRTANE